MERHRDLGGEHCVLIDTALWELGLVIELAIRVLWVVVEKDLRGLVSLPLVSTAGPC